jgi:PilZ domain
MRVRLVFRWRPETAEVAPPPPPQATADHRFYERQPLKSRFVIYASDVQGAQQSIPARSINMSKSGALVESEIPIELNTVVYVKATELGLMGGATVRHCTPRGAKFRIGLYFPNQLTRCL